MRRLWSHIMIAATSILMIGATFATVATNIGSNIEFTTGKELVFRIMQKDEDGTTDKDFVFINDDAVKQTAKIMEQRLKTAEITRYKVETQGYDTIKVSFVQNTDQQYDIIQNYLSFNATLAISNSKETYALATEFLNPDKAAYLETAKNGYPSIVIPINYDNELFQAVYTEAKEMVDSGTGEIVHEHEDEEGETTEEHRTAHLYLWYDYIVDYYSYSKIDRNSEDTFDPIIASKILMTFDAANPFLDEENKDALRAYVQPNDDESGLITPKQLKTAYENGRYFVNLLNAGEMEYQVEFILSQKADLWIEDLFALGSHMTIAWSKTFIATLVSLVVVTLLLVYFFRIGAISIAVATLASTFAGLCFIVLFGAEFNIAAIVGLLAITITSLVSGIIYLTKIKEECYRGRTLKKANAEASKKSLMPIIDLHIVLIVVGIGAYMFGGVIMKGFAVASILGGLASLLINTLALRGLLWLVTNEQGLANRYDLFDVSSDQVPNVLEEEKQQYFGPNENKDYTKKKKPVLIVGLVLLVASVASLITFGVLNDGAVYNTTSVIGNSQIYVEYTSATKANTALSTDVKTKLDTMLDHAYLDDTKLVNLVEVESYDYVSRYEATASGVDTIYYAYYRINFAQPLTGSELISYRQANGDELFNEAAESFFTIEILNSNSGANLNFNVAVDIALKDSIRVNADQPPFLPIFLATLFSLGVSGLYLLLRYRLTRGLTAIGLSIGTITITAGLFSLLQFLPVTSYVSVALPLIALFVSSLLIVLMDKESSMVVESRLKYNDPETRGELLNKATSLSSVPMITAFIVALYLGINYFAFTNDTISWIFLLVIVGAVVSIGGALYLFAPIANYLFKVVSKLTVHIPKPSKRKKARPRRVKKSAEPEEAIFIGIND
ncbi:MAG: hypothetical protein GX813_02545 [Erysipelotrichia bacterium]|nr:hypothetical protein [Erysipelotrichia bacterium]